MPRRPNTCDRPLSGVNTKGYAPDVSHNVTIVWRRCLCVRAEIEVPRDTWSDVAPVECALVGYPRDFR